MTREEAALKLTLHHMQCGMLMPIEWVKQNVESGDLSVAFMMAISALREQEDHIREVTKKVDHIPESGKMMGWISVEDRLPQNDGDMFLVLVTGEYNGIRFSTAYELAYYYQGDGWCLEQYPLYENPGVTHWMPLPEPLSIKI